MKKIALVLLLAFSSCKGDKVQKQSKVETPAYYTYYDQELPFTFTTAHPYGQEVSVFYERSLPSDESTSGYWVTPGIGAAFFKNQTFGFHTLESADVDIDLYDTKELDGYLKKNISRENPAIGLATSSLCFNEIPYIKEGIKQIPIKLYNQSLNRYEQLMAELYTFSDDTGYMNADYYPNDIPADEFYWIILKNSPHLPNDKSIRIKITFPTIFPKDPPEGRHLKEQVTQTLCETARSFTWVDFKGKFSPDRWKEVAFLSKYPAAKVTISDERKK